MRPELSGAPHLRRTVRVRFHLRMLVSRPASLLALVSLATLTACGGGAVASSATQLAPNAPPATDQGGGSPPPAAPLASNSLGAHKLAITAVSCWFGGVWADAIGEAPENRKLSDEARCNDVVRQVWGADDKAKYEQLRALDEHAVEDVITKVGDGTPSGRELRAFVEAQREAMDARRAGERVKKDLAGDREKEKLAPDEVAATRALIDDDALDALVKLSVSDLSHEAHALGVMTAMERIEASRGLPRHLKIYAMQAPMLSLFGMPAPAGLPSDATQPLPKGGYLGYVSDAAKAAGHPVPETAKTPKEREPLAWSGVLAGISATLSPDVSAVPHDSQLPDVLDRVVHRLDAEVKAEQNGLQQGTTTPAATTKAPAAAPATGTKTTTPAAAPKKAPTSK
jgi:hypothetical protein